MRGGKSETAVSTNLGVDHFQQPNRPTSHHFGARYALRTLPTKILSHFVLVMWINVYLFISTVVGYAAVNIHAVGRTDIRTTHSSIQQLLPSNNNDEQHISFSEYLLSSEYNNTASPPMIEMLALQDIYISTNGDGWIFFTSQQGEYPPIDGIPWNFTDITNQNPCIAPWYGIHCFVFTNSSGFSQYHIFEITMYYSNATGTIPESLGNLKYLETLDYTGNHVHGAMPESIGELIHLFFISFSYNQLSGDLPSQLGELQVLSYLYLQNNHLSGQIPAEMGNMSSLLAFYAFGNHLSGTIPPELSRNMTSLQFLVLYANQLTGTIPPHLGLLSKLRYLLVNNNHLVGTVPAEIGALSQLVWLDLEQNLLTGPIPDNLVSNTPFLVYLLLGTNSLTGTIPVAVSNLYFIEVLMLNNNLLIGTLPNVTDATSMTEFSVSYNLLSGSVPHGMFFHMPALSTLQISNNRLTGNLDGIFNATSQPLLSTASLSYNEFTGSLPAEAFRLKGLQSLDITSNCLSGTLPQEICGAASLTGLILDGLSSSTNCRVSLFPFDAHSAYITLNNVKGRLPSCVFELPNLESLQLSGNRFTGSIADVSIAPALRELALSHNSLTGTIPTAMQTHNWDNLDLSFNKLTGELRSDFAVLWANSTLSLQVNRLSGDIPDSLQSAQNIELVNGNIFQCGIADRSALPQNHPGIDNYSCGSNSFDLAAYISLGPIAGLVCLLALLLVTRCKSGQSKDSSNESTEINSACCSPLTWGQSVISDIRTWNATLSDIATDSVLGIFLADLAHLRSVVLGITAVLLFVLLPTYIALSQYYSTYWYEYAWALSAGFLSGETAGIVLFVFWVLVILVAVVLFSRHQLTRPVAHGSSDVAKTSKRMLTLIVVFNVVVVLGVNSFYIWVTLYVDSQSLVTVVEILVALFKLVWNDVAVPTLFAVVHVEVDSSASSKKQQFFYRLCLLLFNNIVAPGAATAAINTNCFFYAVTDPQEISSSYTYHICKTVQVLHGQNVCSQYAPVSATTAYTPPFTYSYQCSSTLITNYAAIFVYLFLIDGFVKPAVLMLLRLLYVNKVGSEAFQKRLGNALPLVLRPHSEITVEHLQGGTLFNRSGFILSLLNMFAILFTFGVVFPPLAVIICANVLVNTYFIQCAIGRLLTAHKDGCAEVVERCKEVLNTQTADVLLLLVNSIQPVLPLTAVFYSFFLFDTIGDQTGWRDAFWAPLSMWCMPILLYFLLWVRSFSTGQGKWFGLRKETAPDRKDDVFLIPSAREPKHHSIDYDA